VISHLICWADMRKENTFYPTRFTGCHEAEMPFRPFGRVR
jgi:hypothetical protein